MAQWLGVGAHILVPRDMASARIQAIESEGAQVTVVNGTYDEAVEASARLADEPIWSSATHPGRATSAFRSG